MQNSLDINELIKVDQLPHVFEQLEEIGKWVDTGLKELDLDNLVVDEEHKKDIKQLRTEINGVTDLLEAKRKEIKAKILEPYQQFDEKYKTEVFEKLNNASSRLTEAVNTIENEQKRQKEEMLRQFFDNYRVNEHLEDIVEFEDVGLNITLSASEKSLKDQIVNFIEKVAEDFRAISSCENKEEVLLEYKHNGFNYSQAVNSVNTKLKAIKDLEQKIIEKQKIDEIEQKVVQNVETLISAPKEVVEEEIITCEFKVHATLSQLQELKKYLNEKGIRYE